MSSLPLNKQNDKANVKYSTMYLADKGGIREIGNTVLVDRFYLVGFIEDNAQTQDMEMSSW